MCDVGESSRIRRTGSRHFEKQVRISSQLAGRHLEMVSNLSNRKDEQRMICEWTTRHEQLMIKKNKFEYFSQIFEAENFIRKTLVINLLFHWRIRVKPPLKERERMRFGLLRLFCSDGVVVESVDLVELVFFLNFHCKRYRKLLAHTQYPAVCGLLRSVFVIRLIDCCLFWRLVAVNVKY